MNEPLVTRVIKIMVFGLLVLLTACSPAAAVLPPTSPTSLPSPSPTQDINATVMASVQQTTQALAPTLQSPTRYAATATSLPATSTSVPATATPTATAQPTATSLPVVMGCQDSAQYISDDGIDGTTYSPNTPFTKTWTVKNTGSCTWDDRYVVSYLNGTTMTQQPGYFIVQQGQTVPPGQTVDVSIGMTSPVENGRYRSDWGLENGNGELMPVQGGANGDSFYVQILVNDGGAAGKVTAASIGMELEQGSGTLCSANATYFVHVSISADGPTEASYVISSTSGQISAGYFEDLNTQQSSPTVSGTVEFNQADTKTVSLRFVGPYPYPDNISVVLRVNGGEFQTAKLSCQE